MFGIGGSEILVILIVALLALGPEKLPDAATKISKGIRELRRQTREVQQTIENDTELGGAIRDLKSALRGDEVRPKVKKALAPLTEAAADAAKTINDATKPAAKPATKKAEAAERPEPEAAVAEAEPAAAAPTADAAEPVEKDEPKEPRILPPDAGEPHDPDAPAPTAEDDAELASMIKPAAGTVAHEPPPKSADGHG
jgi:sec-independent protein translocase protein TatB